MSDKIEIEIDGKILSADKGQMLIEVAEANDIYIPRFCYHHKLSVAANCRMCLVDVEKAPKPLPACATPVMDGMKVQTQSERAVEAQKSVMEFLLINHPLDCPICDQGGECELQDLAMGYGQGVSRYQESKRVVKDKNIGSLVQTDMTRCIHCTRCVRFGEEIAGVRELGATGRGEHMEIGTYIEKAMVSEMSGNVIDLCPVGALTSKPFRYSARAWELTQRETIAPHDCVGSNIYVHTKGNIVKRVVPRENEAINETWISDRDRFSYQGLYHEDRLLKPMIKQGGDWQKVDWQTAISLACNKINKSIKESGEDKIGCLASPNSTMEELYLLQKMMRALGVANLDYRIQQVDFRSSDFCEVYPSMSLSLSKLEKQKAVLLIGSDLRKEQPIINNRLRKAVNSGAKVSLLHVIDVDSNYTFEHKKIVSPINIVYELAAILKAVAKSSNKILPAVIGQAINHVNIESVHESIAKQLSTSNSSSIFLGSFVQSIIDFSVIHILTKNIAQLSGADLHVIPAGSNSSGAYLTGMLPHKKLANKQAEKTGLNINEMFSKELNAYFLLDIEPELDCAQASQALQAMKSADCVVSLTAYQSEMMLDYADVLLPISSFAETSGHKMNVKGEVQAFNGVVSPQGDARPAWKILRVMANEFDLEGFDYNSSEEVYAELYSELKPFIDEKTNITEGVESVRVQLPQIKDDIEVVITRPMNSIDSLVRRAEALQQTDYIADGKLHLSENLADKFSLNNNDKVKLSIGADSIELEAIIDKNLAKNCIGLHGGQTITSEINLHTGGLSLRKVN